MFLEGESETCAKKMIHECQRVLLSRDIVALQISPVTPPWSLMTGALQLLTIVKIVRKFTVRAFRM